MFNAATGSYDIYIANIDGSNMQFIIERASQPALSPNGQQLAFRRWKSDERGIETMNLCRGWDSSAGRNIWKMPGQFFHRMVAN